MRSDATVLVDKDAVVVGRDAGDEVLVSGTGAGLVIGLASGLATDFVFICNGLRLRLVLTPRLGAAFELDLETTLVSSLASNFFPNSAPNSEPDFAVVAARADWSWGCSAAELDMDEASVALKLEGGDDVGVLVAVEAAGVAAGMGIVSTCIGAPRVRLHSMRQWRKADLGLG